MIDLKKHIKQILREEHVSDLKKPFMKYEKLINKLVYDVFDEGICGLSWDVIKLHHREGISIRIILYFTYDSLKEFGYERYGQSKQELKGLIEDYLPKFVKLLHWTNTIASPGFFPRRLKKSIQDWIHRIALVRLKPQTCEQKDPKNPSKKVYAMQYMQHLAHRNTRLFCTLSMVCLLHLPENEKMCFQAAQPHHQNCIFEIQMLLSYYKHH